MDVRLLVHGSAHRIEPPALRGVSADGEQLDRTGRAGRRGKPRVAGQENRVENLRGRDIHRIPTAHGVTQLPRSGQQRAVVEPLAWPGTELLDGAGGSGRIEATDTVFLADDAEDLDVDRMRRRQLFVE
ncbi:MAG TPA: hypothetical protein VKV21_07480 [Solirubrobacteraceae bacterium]|nr:hypothetical protein [Solirubrobacteraceae bacterium]